MGPQCLSASVNHAAAVRWFVRAVREKDRCGYWAAVLDHALKDFQPLAAARLDVFRQLGQP